MERVVDFVLTLGTKWLSWAALIVICVGLVAGALYFQEAMRLYPCELCIYTRVWLVAIALAALPGLVLRKTVWPLRAVIVIELGLAFGLGTDVWELLALEFGWAGAGACSIFANFPSWAPLDEWLPMLFQVQGPCAATPEVVFGLSMADGLAVVTVGVFVGLGAGLCGSFFRGRRMP